MRACLPITCIYYRNCSLRHLDQLVKDGMRFVSMYSSSPVCSPSRSSVLTGRFSAVVCDVSDGKGCSAWDIAANTALFQACGLDLVKVEDGKPYQFVPLDQFDAVKYKNRQPFVAASNPELQRKVLLSMQKYSAEEQ